MSRGDDRRGQDLTLAPNLPDFPQKVGFVSQGRRKQESLSSILWSIEKDWRKDFESLPKGRVVFQYPPIVGEKKKAQRVCKTCLGKSVEDFVLGLLSASRKQTTPLRILVEGCDLGEPSITFYIMDTPMSWAGFGDHAGSGENNIRYLFGFKEDDNKTLRFCSASYSNPSPQLKTLYKETLPTIIQQCEKDGLNVFYCSRDALLYGGVTNKEDWTSFFALTKREAQERWNKVKHQLPRDVVARLEQVYKFEKPEDIRLIADETFQLSDGTMLRYFLIQPFLVAPWLVEMHLKDPEACSRLNAWLKEK